MITPGLFGQTIPADMRRMDFDFANDQLLTLGKRPDYLFIGDSITQQWDLHAYFPTRSVLVNRGAGGDCSTYLRKRFDADCIQLQPKTVLLMIGTNDIFRIERDLWWHKPGETVEQVMADYKENVTDMVQKCDNAGIELILCSVLPSTIAPPFDRVTRWEMTAEMNRFLQTFGKPYVDYHSALTSDGKRIFPHLTPDGIHPNAEGYAIMTNCLKSIIQ